MNLLLLFDEDFVGPDTVRLTDRRAVHAKEVLRAVEGKALRAGKLNGARGTAHVTAQTRESVELRVELTEPPPPRPDVDVLLALPRPKALKKVLPALSSLGVDRVVLCNAARVEKSYFDSKVLTEGWLRELLVLGLEQAQDTRLPELLLRPRFRPFVEDEADALFAKSARLLAHPTAAKPLQALSPLGRERAVLAIGPEGGWVPFEVELLEKHGFVPFSLGPRTLRVETVVPYLFGSLSLLRGGAHLSS